VFKHLISVACLPHEVILYTESLIPLDTSEKQCPQSPRGRMKKTGLADRRTPKGLPSASDPETEGDRTPRESSLACMTANHEPSNQSFEVDREATVCLAKPSLLFEDVCADQSQHRQSIQFGHFAVLIATTDEVIEYLNLCCNALCLLLAQSHRRALN
jgi:hypothetical protein